MAAVEEESILMNIDEYRYEESKDGRPPSRLPSCCTAHSRTELAFLRRITRVIELFEWDRVGEAAQRQR